jgi:hypothetical protein
LHFSRAFSAFIEAQRERKSPLSLSLSLCLSFEEHAVIYMSVKLLPVTSATTRGAYGAEVAFFFNLVKFESTVDGNLIKR